MLKDIKKTPTQTEKKKFSDNQECSHHGVLSGFSVLLW